MTVNFISTGSGEPEISSLTSLLTLLPQNTLTSNICKICEMGLIIRYLWVYFFLTTLQLSELAPEDLWLPSPKSCSGERKAFLILPFSIPVLQSPFRCLLLWLPLFPSFQEFFPKQPASVISQLLSSPLPTFQGPWEPRPEKQACAELRELWGLPLPVRLCLGTEMDG